MNGFLCIDKEKGKTSRDAVNVIQRLIRPIKIGHAGTLDPMATGVLVMALGKATKLISHVQQMPKVYAADFQLGATSNTEDITGDVIQNPTAKVPEHGEVVDVSSRFVGDILQLPPTFSALKVNGRRAHALARAGETVTLSPRPIQIHTIDVTRYEYPHLSMNVKCGSGTYIRSLGRDIGAALGCGAVMSGLRRTSIGQFSINKACVVQQFATEQDLKPHLHPLIDGTTLPTYPLSSTERQDLAYGRKIDFDTSREATFAATSPAGELLAVMTQVEGRRYRSVINFCVPD